MVLLPTFIVFAFIVILFKTLFVKPVPVLEQGGFQGDDVVVDGKTVSAEVPHLSRFVFAYIAREESDAPVEESSKPEDVSDPVDDNSSTGSESETSNDVRPNRDDKDGYKTGENSNATAIVFAVMSAAALGIALAASKTKKSAE